ncbi:hypothetical protein B0H34DRAFT_717988 [Crassisporium funariophilum]|nr:hypothetical protein B0H34DRAFT_717988 [Crassisporium funariophilum]
MSLPPIPLEICSRIVDEVDDEDKGTICALSLSCKWIHCEAEKILYRSMTHSDARKHVSFLAKIIRDPRRAQFVRKYSSYGLVVFQREPLWALTLRGLPAMVNLKEFTFRAFSGTHVANLLQNCTFQLDKLHWHNSSFIDENLELAHFLVKQRNLRHFGLRFNPTFNFPPKACPNLESFEGNWRTLTTIFPGRNITRLTWSEVANTPSWTSYFPPISEHCRHLQNLTWLVFGGWLPRPQLKLIIDNLHALRFLGLAGCHDGELELFPKLPKLTHLAITFYWSTSESPIRDAKERADIVSELFSKCLRLEIVDIGHEKSKDAPNLAVYQRWIQNVLQKEVVPEAQVLSGWEDPAIEAEPSFCPPWPNS